MTDRRRSWEVLGMKPGATAERPVPVKFLQTEFYLTVGDMSHSFGHFENILILISNKFEEVFVLLNKTVFYDITVSRKRRSVPMENRK